MSFLCYLNSASSLSLRSSLLSRFILDPFCSNTPTLLIPQAPERFFTVVNVRVKDNVSGPHRIDPKLWLLYYGSP
jgi:hypothetical protein